MKRIKCIICGEPIELNEDNTYGKCYFCGHEWNSEPLSEINFENLKLACDYYFESDFEEAKRHFTALANNASKLYQAWWGAFLSEYNIKLKYDKYGDLYPYTSKPANDIFANVYYRSAIKYAPDDVKNEYIAIIDKMDKTDANKNEKTKFVFDCKSAFEKLSDNEEIYQFALNLYNEADSRHNYFFSKEVFEKIKNYKDSLKYINSISSQWEERVRLFKENLSKYVMPFVIEKEVDILNQKLCEERKKLRLNEEMRKKIVVYTEEKQKAIKRIDEINFEMPTLGFFGKKRKKQLQSESGNLLNIITMCDESIAIINQKIKDIDAISVEYIVDELKTKVAKLKAKVSMLSDYFDKDKIKDKKFTCVINDVIKSDEDLGLLLKNGMADIITLNTDIITRVEKMPEYKDCLTDNPETFKKFKKDYQIKNFDCITIGEYIQSDNKKQPIVWIAVKNVEDKTLLLSKKCIDVMPYNEVCDETALWNTSTIRNYLNGDFFEKSFSDEEKQIIVSSFNKRADFYAPGEKVEVDYGDKYQTEKVFCITFDEFLLLDEKYKVAGVTDYVKNLLNTNEDRCPWWLKNYSIVKRKIGAKDILSCTASAVTIKGKEFGNFQVDTKNIAVRPAIWINKKFD